MGKDHRGKPSGVDKEEGMDVRPSMPPEKLKSDEEMMDRYTDENDQLKDHVPVRHPNRNTSKDNDAGTPYA